jgi:hypothetical protein
VNMIAWNNSTGPLSKAVGFWNEVIIIRTVGGIRI